LGPVRLLGNGRGVGADGSRRPKDATGVETGGGKLWLSDHEA